MELYEKEVLRIFQKNFLYPIVETPLGTAIKMDAIEAFDTIRSIIQDELGLDEEFEELAELL